GADLVVVGTEGYPPELSERWPRFPVAGSFPLSDAVRERRVVLLPDADTRRRLYPALAEARFSGGDHAFAGIPLEAANRVSGGIGLSFPTIRQFLPDDVADLEALARLCAQALDRAQLYEGEARARRRAEKATQDLAFLAD